MHGFMVKGRIQLRAVFVVIFSTHWPDSRENVKRLRTMVTKKLKSHFIVLRAFYNLYRSIYIL